MAARPRCGRSGRLPARHRSGRGWRREPLVRSRGNLKNSTAPFLNQASEVGHVDQIDIVVIRGVVVVPRLDPPVRTCRYVTFPEANGSSLASPSRALRSMRARSSQYVDRPSWGAPRGGRDPRLSSKAWFKIVRASSAKETRTRPSLDVSNRYSTPATSAVRLPGANFSGTADIRTLARSLDVGG